MGRPRAPGPQKEIVLDWILSNRAGVSDALAQFWPDLTEGPERKKVYQRVSVWLAVYKKENAARGNGRGSPSLGRRVLVPPPQPPAQPGVSVHDLRTDDPDDDEPAGNPEPSATMPEHVLTGPPSGFLEWQLRIVIRAFLDVVSKKQYGLLPKMNASVSDVFADLCKARAAEGSSGKMEATPAALAAEIRKEEGRIKALLAAREQAAARKEKAL